MANRREMEKMKARRTNAKKVAEKQQGGFTPAWLKKLPNGIQMLRLKEEKVYKLDCVPFLVGSENPNADAGMEHFERTVYTHSGIGLDPKAHYLCPLMTSKEGKAKKMRPCPVCEHAQKLQLSGAGKDETDPYRPKKRQLMMFIDTKDRERGVQLHEGPYFFGLGQLIDNKMDALDEDSLKLNWWTYDEGMSLHVNVKKANFKGQSYMKPVDLEIEPRTKQYDASLMEKGCCLDDLVKELPYDELKEIFSQTGSADEEGDDEDTKAERNGEDGEGGYGTPSPEDNDETAEDLGIKVGCRVKHKKFGECEVVHVSKDGTSLKLEDEDAEVHGAVAPADCKLIDANADDTDDPDEEADDDDPPPAKGKKRPPVDEDNDGDDSDLDDSDDDQDSDDEDIDSELEEDEPDEEPPAKAAKGKATGKGKVAKAPADDDEDLWEDDDPPPAKVKKRK